MVAVSRDKKYRLSWGCGRSDIPAVERRVWVVVWNLKDVEGVEIAFPAIGVFRMRNSCYKASRVMNSGVRSSWVSCILEDYSHIFKIVHSQSKRFGSLTGHLVKFL